MPTFAELMQQHFYNPPAGGNDRGVDTANIMKPQGAPRFAQERDYGIGGGNDAAGYPVDESGRSGAGVQGMPVDMFAAGIRSASEQQNSSGAAGQPEMRNYRRDWFNKATEQKGAHPLTVYDEEAAIDGTAQPMRGNDRQPIRLVTPQYQPPRAPAFPRTDGRK